MKMNGKAQAGSPLSGIIRVGFWIATAPLSVLFVPVALTFLLVSCQEDKSEPEGANWTGMQVVLNQIEVPEIPDTVFNVLDFGAVADGITDALPAIRMAIDRCAAAGGGQVRIPPGQYFVQGPIHLVSYINLHVEEGATLLFSTNPGDYLPVVLSRWEGVELYNYSPLVYAQNQSNLAITGGGVLDGQASNENWWSWSGSKQYGWQAGMPCQRDTGSRDVLYEMNEKEVPVQERIFGEGTFLRPNFIQFINCNRIRIDGVTIKNSPMWVIHPVLSESITISNVKVVSHGPNSDGCDPESSKNVLIENCYFDTGDDCIALKSGRNQDGRRLRRPVENIVIRDCIMKDGHGGVVIGSEVSGGARAIYAENCQMDSPNLDRAIRIKTNSIRGGIIEDLYFRNIRVGQVREAVIKVNMHYAIYSNPEQEPHYPVVRRIFVEDLQSSKSKYGLLIEGYDAQHTVDHLFLKNIHFNGVEEGNRIAHAYHLVCEDVFVNEQPLVLEKADNQLKKMENK